MNEFLPQVIGLGFVALLLAFALFFPRSPWTATLFERYGVRHAADAQHLTRADHVRGAVAAIGAAVLLFAVGAALFLLAERYANGTSRNLLALEFMLMFTMLGALALACAIVAAWNAVRWRPAVVAPSLESGLSDER